MLRIGGAVLLLTVSLCYAARRTGEEAQARGESEAFLALVRYMREGIAAYRTETPVLYAAFSHPALAACGFLPDLQTYGLGGALTRSGDRLVIPEDVRTVLAAFAAEVGGGHAAPTLALCDRTVATLEKIVEKQKKEAPGRTRVLWTGAVCGSLMLVILLL